MERGLYRLQAVACQLLQVAVDCLVADAVTALVGEHRVAEPGMAQAMAQQGQPPEPLSPG
jgi:hypothetical protein